MEYHSRLPVACPQHPERSLEQLCCDCAQAICWKCLVADHGPHKARELEPGDLHDPALRVPGGSRLNRYCDPVTMTTTDATADTDATSRMTLALDNARCDCKDAPTIALDDQRDELLLLYHADLRKDALFLQDEMDAFEFLDTEADALRRVLLDRGSSDSAILKACQDWTDKLSSMEGVLAQKDVHFEAREESPAVDAGVCEKDASLGNENEMLFVEMGSLRQAFLGTDRNSLTVDSVREQIVDLGKGAVLDGKDGFFFEEADTLPGELLPRADKNSPLPAAVSAKDMLSFENQNEFLLREMDALLVLDKMAALRSKDGSSLGAENSFGDADKIIKDDKNTSDFGQMELRAEVSALRGKERTLHGVK